MLTGITLATNTTNRLRCYRAGRNSSSGARGSSAGRSKLEPPDPEAEERRDKYRFERNGFGGTVWSGSPHS